MTGERTGGEWRQDGAGWVMSSAVVGGRVPDTRSPGLPWHDIARADPGDPSLGLQAGPGTDGDLVVTFLQLDNRDRGPNGQPMTEDDAVRLVRYAYDLVRRESLQRRTWSLLNDATVEQLRAGLPAHLTDVEFAGIYRMLTTSHGAEAHEPALAMAGFLHLAHGTVRNRVMRLRKVGILGPADGTRPGEKAPPRKPRTKTTKTSTKTTRGKR